MIDQSIKKVLVIGSGPIIIGQAAEFDYAGTQACRSLHEEGVEVVLHGHVQLFLSFHFHTSSKFFWVCCIPLYYHSPKQAILFRTFLPAPPLFVGFSRTFR